MNVKIADLMTSNVLTATRHQTVGHVRTLMASHGIHALPVVDSDKMPVGVVTTSDLMSDVSPTSRVGTVMSKQVVTIPAYSQPRIAARTMRNKGFHHLVVTHEKKIVGILSTFDLLRLLEDHSFSPKNAPKVKQRKATSRKR